MGRQTRYPDEVRELAARMLTEHEGEAGPQWERISSIAEKIGCTSETLRNWIRQAEIDRGRRAGLTSDERRRMKELERENRELRRAMVLGADVITEKPMATDELKCRRILDNQKPTGRRCRVTFNYRYAPPRSH